MDGPAGLSAPRPKAGAAEGAVAPKERGEGFAGAVCWYQLLQSRCWTGGGTNLSTGVQRDRSSARERLRARWRRAD